MTPPRPHRDPTRSWFLSRCFPLIHEPPVLPPSITPQRRKKKRNPPSLYRVSTNLLPPSLPIVYYRLFSFLLFVYVRSFYRLFVHEEEFIARFTQPIISLLCEKKDKRRIEIETRPKGCSKKRREKERERRRGGGLSAGGMEGEESVIPDDQRAADSALMSSSNDKWRRGPRLSLTTFILGTE